MLFRTVPAPVASTHASIATALHGPCGMQNRQLHNIAPPSRSPWPGFGRRVLLPARLSQPGATLLTSSPGSHKVLTSVHDSELHGSSDPREGDCADPALGVLTQHHHWMILPLDSSASTCNAAAALHARLARQGLLGSAEHTPWHSSFAVSDDVNSSKVQGPGLPGTVMLVMKL